MTLSVLSSFAIILGRKRERLFLCFSCIHVAMWRYVFCDFSFRDAVRKLHYVIVAFSGQTHLLFDFVVGFSIESSSLNLS